MSAVELTYKIDGTDAIVAKFGQLQRALADTTPIMGAIGLGLVRNTKDRFSSQTDPNGGAWKALTPDYAAMKKGPGILRESRTLFNTITYKASRDSVEVGPNTIYAAIHQFGGTIKPKQAKALAFPSQGGISIVRKAVTIPARPYLGINDADRELILDVVETALGQAIAS